MAANVIRDAATGKLCRTADGRIARAPGLCTEVWDACEHARPPDYINLNFSGLTWRGDKCYGSPATGFTKFTDPGGIGDGEVACFPQVGSSTCTYNWAVEFQCHNFASPIARVTYSAAFWFISGAWRIVVGQSVLWIPVRVHGVFDSNCGGASSPNCSGSPTGAFINAAPNFTSLPGGVFCEPITVDNAITADTDPAASPGWYGGTCEATPIWL